MVCEGFFSGSVFESPQRPFLSLSDLVLYFFLDSPLFFVSGALLFSPSQIFDFLVGGVVQGNLFTSSYRGWQRVFFLDHLFVESPQPPFSLFLISPFSFLCPSYLVLYFLFIESPPIFYLGLIFFPESPKRH